MKKTFCLCMAAAISFAACNNDDKKAAAGGDDAIIKKNLEACHAINKAIETGDVSKLDAAIAADAIDYSGSPSNPLEPINGLENIKKNLAGIHTMADSMHTEVTREWADKDYVVQWLHFSGLAKSGDMGLPPGTKFDMKAIELCQMKDGKLAAHWEYVLMSDMMKMMAAAPPPQAVKTGAAVSKGN